MESAGPKPPRPNLAVLLFVGVGQSKQHRCKASLASSRCCRLVSDTPTSGLELKRVCNVLRGLTSIVVDQFLEHGHAPGFRSAPPILIVRLPTSTESFPASTANCSASSNTKPVKPRSPLAVSRVPQILVKAGWWLRKMAYLWATSAVSIRGLPTAAHTLIKRFRCGRLHTRSKTKVPIPRNVWGRCYLRYRLPLLAVTHRASVSLRTQA